MRKPILDLRGFIGVNIRDTDLRLTSKGKVEFVDCGNVYITDRFTVKSFPSFKKVGVMKPDCFLSLEGVVFYSSNDRLYEYPDKLLFTFSYPILFLSGVRDGTVCYLSTLRDLFLVDLGNNSFISFPEVKETKLLGKLPAGNLAFCRGILFSAIGSTLYFSNPFEPFIYDRRRGFMEFSSSIIDLCATSSSLVVSDESAVYVVINSEEGFIRREVYDSPALRNSMVKGSIYLDGVYREGVVFSSKEGVFGVVGDQLITLNDRVLLSSSDMSGIITTLDKGVFYIGKIL